jgi:hypothetical protein
VNHIAIGRALSPGENYSLLIMGDNNVDGDDGEDDGDGVESMTAIEMALGALPEGFRSIENKKISYDDEQEQAKIRSTRCKTTSERD